MEIIFSLSAAREIRKLEPGIRKRILHKLEEYRYKPALLEGDLKRLEGARGPAQYRLRVGDYRTIIPALSPDQRRLARWLVSASGFAPL